ncbi:hypothetical protein GSI_09103 [Ganoderma sinense ZZ0214-1]|uniref:F-box domain-containing protein n=1 Tax=Ganoderma sinense ZZ0214-1 TaxID=1077348 RepID=A0A2G8S5M9_9APHY|nr:hypothetical protein GSI_09103 [Ganoderma sinense ZZ0214-1]
MPRLSKVKRLLQDLRGRRSPEPKGVTHPAEAAPVEVARLSNQSLPIHQLPNELLIRIFLLVCLKGPVSLEGPQAKDMDNATRMTLMLVCRFWRDVALATPIIWRFIEMGRDVYWTKLALTRSDPSTIDIDMRRSTISSEELELLYPHAHRIRRLDFYEGNNKPQSSALHTLCDLGMPALEELALGRSPFIGPTLANQPGIHTKLSSQQYPRLRMLCLSRITMPCDPLLYSKLHSLILMDCDCDYSFDQFLDILSSCSSTLQKLYLVSFLDRLSDSEPEAKPRRSLISLPRMGEMGLWRHLSCYSSHLIAHLSIPITARIEVHAEGGTFSTNDPRANGSLVDAIPRDHPTTFPVLSALVRAELETPNQGPTYTLSGDTRRSGTTYLVELRYNPAQRVGPGGNAPFASHRELLPRSLDDLVALLRGPSLRCLSICGISFLISQAKWLEVLGAFPNLEELRVSDNGPMVGLVGALQFEPSPGPSSSIPEPRAGQLSPILCPELSFLALELECDLYSTLLGLLIDCMQYRAENGSRLHKLEVRSLSPADTIKKDWNVFMAGLEGLVPEVSYVFQPPPECGTPEAQIIYR